jgi:hypothetical protein
VLNSSTAAQPDVIRETMYHELSHAAHFSRAGEDFWKDNIDFVIGNVTFGRNAPYGFPDLPGAGRCGLIESFGFALGPHFADQRYGVLHSRFPPGDAGRWAEDIEIMLFTTPQETHIKPGWLYDLIDDNANNPFGERWNINDQVRGYTPAGILNNMGGAASLIQFRNTLGGQLPPGVTGQQYNNLANGYIPW